MAKKILVVDDDQSILEVIRIVLEQYGFDVITLDNGKEVKQTVLNEKPQMLLLDFWIPGMDGGKVIAALKSDPQTAKLPVVIVSAANGIEKTAKEIKADGVLPKPFSIEALEETVTKFLR